MPHTCRFAAVVFDLDGILVETEELWDVVRRGLAAAEGLPWPEDATTAMMGMSTPEWATYLSETVGLSSTPEQSARRTIDAMAARYRERGVPLLPGARDVVPRLAAGLPLGLNSSSPRQLIDTVLGEMGWDDLFTATVSTEEVARGKPAPDGFLECARLLGADPARCVAVEDATNGLRSAMAAGMTTVAVPPHFHPPAADVLAACDAVVHSLDDLTIEFLRQLPPRR